MKLKIEDWISLILIVTFSFLSVYDLQVYSPQMPFKYRIIFYILIFVVDITIVILYILFKRKKDIPIEKKFLYISFVIGMFYLICIPSMKGTDEPPHLFRIYQITQGNIIVDDYEKDYNMIPDNLFSYAWGWGSDAYRPSKVFEKLSPNMIKLNNGHVAYKYAPTQYIPQIIGFSLASFLNFGPVLLGLTTRLSNFLIWLIISYFAIKRFPCNKGFVCLLYSAPAMLSLVSTMSGDAFLNACALYYIAMILDIFVNKKEVIKTDLVLMIFLAIIIASVKIVYIPLILFVFIINKKQFKSKKNYLTLIIGIISSIVLALLWNSLSAPSGDLESAALTTKQLSFILHNPIEYCLITFRTFTNNFYYYITNLFAGHEMCYTIVKINDFLVLFYLVLAIVSLQGNKEKISFNKIQKICIWSGFFFVFCATVTAMYLYFTTITGGVGHSEIIGVQSRYFIILIPILALTIPAKYNKKIDMDRIINLSFVLNGMMLIQSIGSLIAACYNK